MVAVICGAYLAVAKLYGLPPLPEYRPSPRNSPYQGGGYFAAALAAFIVYRLRTGARERKRQARQEWERATKREAERAQQAVLAAKKAAEAARQAAQAAEARRRQEAAAAQEQRRQQLAKLETWFIWNAAQYRLSVDATGTADPGQLARGFLERLQKEHPQELALLAHSTNPEVRAILDQAPGARKTARLPAP